MADRLERTGRALRLLGRVGASRGQVAAAFGWHALFVTVTGVVAGAAAGAVTLVAVTRAATGSWVPFIPLAPAAGLVIAVAALVAGAVMVPFYVDVPPRAGACRRVSPTRLPSAAWEGASCRGT